MTQIPAYQICDRFDDRDWQRFHDYGAAHGWGQCFGSCDAVQFKGWQGDCDLATYELWDGVELGIDWIGNAYKRIEALDERGRLMHDRDGKVIRLSEWVPAGEARDCYQDHAYIRPPIRDQAVHGFVVFEASVTSPSDHPRIAEFPDAHGDFITTRWSYHPALLDRQSLVRLEIHRGTTKLEVLRLLDKIAAMIARDNESSMPQPPDPCCGGEANAGVGI